MSKAQSSLSAVLPVKWPGFAAGGGGGGGGAGGGGGGGIRLKLARTRFESTSLTEQRRDPVQAPLHRESSQPSAAIGARRTLMPMRNRALHVRVQSRPRGLLTRRPLPVIETVSVRLTTAVEADSPADAATTPPTRTPRTAATVTSVLRPHRRFVLLLAFISRLLSRGLFREPRQGARQRLRIAYAHAPSRRPRASRRGVRTECTPNPRRPRRRRSSPPLLAQALRKRTGRSPNTLPAGLTNPLVVAHRRLPTANPKTSPDRTTDPHLVGAHLATAAATNHVHERRADRPKIHTTKDDHPPLQMLSLRKRSVTAQFLVRARRRFVAFTCSPL